MDRNLTAKNLKEFLKDNGYNWSGYVANNRGHGIEEYYQCDKYLGDLNNMYILLGSQNDWDEDYGWVNVVDSNKSVKYIRQDDSTFKVYKAIKGGKFELEKDLSNEWVRYQALNIEGYADDELNFGRYIQANYPRQIENRKNLLAQEIERITKEANSLIESMEESITRSKEVEKIIKQVQEERLIQQQIELGAKDNFKDNTSNDACLKHLIDTFGSGK